jgi:hypothetical protein
MIVTEAHIISGLVIKAKGEKSPDSCVIMGHVAQQFPAKLTNTYLGAGVLTGFFGWEGTIVVSQTNKVNIYMLTGVSFNVLGAPDLTELRGLDWEGVTMPTSVILRAFMIENLGTTALRIMDTTGGNTTLFTIHAGGTLHLSGPPVNPNGMNVNSLQFFRTTALMEPVRITCLVEVAD